MGLSLVGVLMLSSTLSLTKIVEQQTGLWNIVLQPLGFVIYYICAIAEVNRLPFDLPEAETELIAGYLTEYASIKVAFFFMAEYINMMTVSAIAVSLFWGGWQAPFGLFPGWWWFVIKVALSLFLFMWLRGTFPRFRYDQLMNFGWKILFPLALVNIAITIVEVVVFRL
jgi:NADH-quinone oxidoreductase subunit H